MISKGRVATGHDDKLDSASSSRGVAQRGWQPRSGRQLRAFPQDVRTVGDLSSPAERLAVLDDATLRLAYWLGVAPQRRIPFGSPVCLAFGIDPAHARSHALAGVLLCRGADLSLAWRRAVGADHKARPVAFESLLDADINAHASVLA